MLGHCRTLTQRVPMSTVHNPCCHGDHQRRAALDEAKPARPAKAVGGDGHAVDDEVMGADRARGSLTWGEPRLNTPAHRVAPAECHSGLPCSAQLSLSPAFSGLLKYDIRRGAWARGTGL